MSNYIKYSVSLSENQKAKLAKALMNKSAITLRLSVGEFSGSDELFLTQITNTQIKNIQKAKSMNKAVDLKTSKTQISRVVKKGGEPRY